MLSITELCCDTHDRQSGCHGENQTHLFSQLPAERLELEAGWIAEVVAVNLSCQEDTELHHLLQHRGEDGLHSDVVVQLGWNKDKCAD